MKHSLIVGCGLAGFHYANTLQKEKKDFYIIADQAEGASRNAGGVLNPTVLKRYTMAWKGTVFFNTALSTYKQFEKKHHTSVFVELPIHHYFNQSSDHNNWSVAAQKEGLNDFLLAPIKHKESNSIKAKFGHAVLQKVGKVEIKKILDLFKEHLLEDQFIEEVFDYNALEIHKDAITYKGLKAKHIVFCEGYGLKKNPWFSYLPLTGSKGEFLHIRAKGLTTKAIIKGGLFIVPIAEDLFWVGASFAREDKTLKPTATGKKWLLSKLKQRLKIPFDVVYHGTAIRPTVQDRRPLLGVHPQYKNLFVFNGLGTRGVMMGHLLSQWLYTFIERKKELPTEVAIDRFETYFSNPKK